jgi:hypothetical protein
MNGNTIDWQSWRHLQISDESTMWFFVCFGIFALVLWAWEGSDDL